MDKLAEPHTEGTYTSSTSATEASKANWIVVTDLDGTLLDHNTYSFQAAKATLAKLEANGVPVIINSSKTAAEIEELRQALGNRHPFIVENGSGVLVPKGYFEHQPEGTSSWSDYWEVTLGKSRDQIIQTLNTLPLQLRKQFKNYHRCSVFDVVEMTGLSRPEAQKSMDRRYSEPLKWLGTDEEKTALYAALRKAHLHYTEGGRFIHIMGHTNKGSAISWLTRYYQDRFQKPTKVVALGDAPNDIDMLKVANIAVVIRSPVNGLPQFEHECKIVSDSTGAEGWAETIENIFFKPQ